MLVLFLRSTVKYGIGFPRNVVAGPSSGGGREEESTLKQKDAEAVNSDQPSTLTLGRRMNLIQALLHALTSQGLQWFKPGFTMSSTQMGTTEPQNTACSSANA